MFASLTRVDRSGGSAGPQLDLVDDGMPAPPPELITQVGGTPDLGWFLQFGRACFQLMRDLLESHDVQIERMERVLDFGCGCGRVLRHWQGVTGPAVHGADYNPELIAWCQECLPFGRYHMNELEPPLGYAMATFDFVYAISVFTHLSEKLQRSWINELGRVLKPEGYLLLTTHGASYRESLNPLEQRRFDAGQPVTGCEDAAGTNLCGASHPESYVRTELAQAYQVLDFVSAGTRASVYQDVFLLQKSPKRNLKTVFSRLDQLT